MSDSACDAIAIENWDNNAWNWARRWVDRRGIKRRARGGETLKIWQFLVKLKKRPPGGRIERVVSWRRESARIAADFVEVGTRSRELYVGVA